MRVRVRVDQLDVHPHSVTSFLDAAFKHSGDAEFVGNCLQVFRLAFVFGRGSSGDNFQVSDAGEFGHDFALSAVGEIGVPFFLAQIFKGEHGNTLFRDR